MPFYDLILSVKVLPETGFSLQILDEVQCPQLVLTAGEDREFSLGVELISRKCWKIKRFLAARTRNQAALRIEFGGEP